MSRKKRKFEENATAADAHLRDMKFKDLKRECVSRGMDFEDVIAGNIPKLSNWFRDHYFDPVLPKLLDQFDDWQEELIRDAMLKKGQDPNTVIHPALRLGYIAEKDEEGNVTKAKRVKLLVKKKKKKRERTQDGIFQGTKKSLTYTLQKEGKSKEETIKTVLEQFPDASEKSISIWYNKAKKFHAKPKMIK